MSSIESKINDLEDGEIEEDTFEDISECSLTDTLDQKEGIILNLYFICLHVEMLLSSPFFFLRVESFSVCLLHLMNFSYRISDGNITSSIRNCSVGLGLQCS